LNKKMLRKIKDNNAFFYYGKRWMHYINI